MLLKNTTMIKLSALLVMGGICAGTVMYSKSNAQNAANPPSPIPNPQAMLDTNGLNKQIDKAGYMTFTTGLDNSGFLIDEQDSKAYLYLEAKTGKYEPVGKKRAPLNLTVVIDHSGSMSGDKILYAKKAAKYVVDKLSETDFLSIVMYDSQVSVVWPSQAVKDKEKIKKLIDGITDNSGTNLGGGLLEGYVQTKKSFKADYVNRVLLMSDGLANEGITSQDALQKIAKENCQEYKISLSTFGIGLDFNENLMTGIAEHGCGRYYFIDDPEHIPTIFEQELNGLLNLVASDVKLKVKIPKGMNLEKVFGYKYDQKDDVVTVDFRDMFANNTKAVLLKFTVLAGTNTVQEFSASLDYKSVTGDQKLDKNLTAINKLAPAENKAAYDKSVCEKVKEQVILFESNDLMEQSLIETDKGNYDRARSLNTQNTNYLNSNAGYVNKSAELQKQKLYNDSYEKDLKNVETKGEQEKKSMQKKSKESNYKAKMKY